MKNIKIKYFLLALVAVVVVLGGVMFAAKNATPESPIYTLRINVLEKLTEMTKSDEYAKAEYALALGGQRLSELEVLKEKQMLDTVVGNMARDNFNQQTISVQSVAMNLAQKEGLSSQKVLQLAESLEVQIEQAKVIFNIDQLEVVDEGVPVEKVKSTKK
jgi:hypothetical protein